jgi:hypothetical protein
MLTKWKNEDHVYSLCEGNAILGCNAIRYDKRSVLLSNVEEIERFYKVIRLTQPL